jgi:hypothetical protein
VADTDHQRLHPTASRVRFPLLAASESMTAAQGRSVMGRWTTDGWSSCARKAMVPGG